MNEKDYTKEIESEALANLTNDFNLNYKGEEFIKTTNLCKDYFRRGVNSKIAIKIKLEFALKIIRKFLNDNGSLEGATYKLIQTEKKLEQKLKELEL